MEQARKTEAKNSLKRQDLRQEAEDVDKPTKLFKFQGSLLV